MIKNNNKSKAWKTNRSNSSSQCIWNRSYNQWIQLNKHDVFHLNEDVDISRKLILILFCVLFCSLQYNSKHTHTLLRVLVLRAHGHRTHPQFAFSEFINQEATHSSKHTHISIVIVIVLCCVVPTAEWRWRRSHTAGKTDVCIIRRSVSSARIRNTIFCAAGQAVPLGQSSLKIPFTINSPQLHQNVLL